MSGNRSLRGRVRVIAIGVTIAVGAASPVIAMATSAHPAGAFFDDDSPVLDDYGPTQGWEGPIEPARADQGFIGDDPFNEPEYDVFHDDEIDAFGNGGETWSGGSANDDWGGGYDGGSYGGGWGGGGSEPWAVTLL